MLTSIEELARHVVGDDRNTVSQCRKLIAWIYAEFEWSSTDYQRRTVEEILNRRAGNCAEQARLLKSLLQALGVETRDIAEINIQPPWPERGRRAKRMAEERGPAASVFGYQHNDHRWLEVYDGSSGLWFPADATLGICGHQEWLAARMGFGPRPESGKDMIVPIMVFVMDAADQVQEDRTDYYLISLFTQYVEDVVPAGGLLRDWSRVIRALAQGGKRAFAGVESFFPYGKQVQHALDVYRAIERQCQ